MDWHASWDEPFANYLGSFQSLIGDKRTAFTFAQTIEGIIAAGSLVCSQIASHAPQLAANQYAAQRILRLVKGDTTTRSQLDADHLTAQLRAAAVEQLQANTPEEVWLVADGSDLRKPYAKQMPNLMQVRDLQGHLVPGYATLNVIGISPGHRYILYHKLYSSTAADFVSAPLEEKQAVETVMNRLSEMPAPPVASWILDRGFDSIKLWGEIWAQQAHLVVRIYHDERVVSYRDQQGAWQAGQIKQARRQTRPLAKVRTKLPLGIKGREIEVTVQLSAVAMQVSYTLEQGEGQAPQPLTKRVWLVEAVVLGHNLSAWLLITDWPVEDAAAAQRVFTMYRQRWSIEDGFKFTKECLGWEEVQVLDLAAIRTLVAMAWVAAGYLYEMGMGLDEPTVKLLARLGGWDGCAAHKPGKIVLTRGLQRVLNILASEAILRQHISEHGELPPRIAAMLGQRKEL